MISIATPYQFKQLSRGEDSVTWNVNVPSGNLLMACIGHERDSTINTVAWNGTSMSKWASYPNPTSGWQALSIYALKSFAQGTYNFTFNQTGMYGYTYLMLLSWDGVGTYKSVDQTGHEVNIGTASYWYTQNIITDPNDLAIMLVRSADGGLAYHNDRQFCSSGGGGSCAIQGLYAQAYSGTYTSISQQMSSYDFERHVDCLTLAMSPAEITPPPPPTSYQKIVWFM